MTLERKTSGHHLVEGDAKREEVGALIHDFTPGLLRGHVSGRAEDLPSARHLFGAGLFLAELWAKGILLLLDELGQPEVEDPGAAVGTEDDVLGLQVPVDDT